MSERLTRLLGLGLRAGRVVVGVTGVRAGLQRESVHCVVLAADASTRTLDKVERLARARGIPVLRGPVADELGARSGAPAGPGGRCRRWGARARPHDVFGGVSGDNTHS